MTLSKLNMSQLVGGGERGGEKEEGRGGQKKEGRG